MVDDASTQISAEKQNLIASDSNPPVQVDSDISPPEYTAIDLSGNIGSGDKQNNNNNNKNSSSSASPDSNLTNGFVGSLFKSYAMDKLGDNINFGTISNITLEDSKSFLVSQKDALRPWTDFVNTGKFSKPKNLSQITSRVTKNIKNYQANYLVVFLLFSIYCVLTSPLLLFAGAAAYGVRGFLKGDKGVANQQKFIGRELTEKEHAVVSGVVSAPIFILCGALSAVMWTLTATGLAVGAHASCKEPEVDPEEQDTFLEPEDNV